MVMDVIKAVQETIAYFCQPHSRQQPSSVTTSGGSSAAVETTTATDSSSTSASGVVHNCYSSLAARGVSGQSSLLTVVNPLMVLISDGLLPPQTRAIFTSKPKSRIWALVEESCRPCEFYLDALEHLSSDNKTPVTEDHLWSFKLTVLSAKWVPCVSLVKSFTFFFEAKHAERECLSAFFLGIWKKIFWSPRGQAFPQSLTFCCSHLGFTRCD